MTYFQECPLEVEECLCEFLALNMSKKKKKIILKNKKVYSFAQLAILFSLPSTTMPSPVTVVSC